MPNADDNGIVNADLNNTKLNQIKIKETTLKKEKKIDTNVYITKCFINSKKKKLCANLCFEQ